MVRGLMDGYRRRHPERQVSLVVPTETTPVVGAWEAMEEVVDNLISNADKYSAVDRPIEVSIRVESAAVVISVADRGLGFGNADMAELFKPFVRSDAARAAAPGLGVGLTIAERLVQAHGGRIWAKIREGGGAEVTVSSQRMPSHPSRAMPWKPLERPTPSGGARGSTPLATEM